MVRGEALMGRAEAATFGILIAAGVRRIGAHLPRSESLGFLRRQGLERRPVGGSSLHFAWGTRTTFMATCDRVWIDHSGDRATLAVEGYACILGAVLVALWFAFSRSAPEQRSWWRAMAGIAALALLAGCVVSWAKSGVLVGQAVKEYVDFHVLHQNQINGGEYFSPLYFPTNLWSYLGPTGVRFTGYFPFITLPAGPPAAIGGVDFFFLERSSSVLTSMPLLVGLAFMAVVGAVRRYVDPVVAMLRLLLVAAAVGLARCSSTAP